MTDKREELSPLWCANDAPHEPHSAPNAFGSTNHCTGRPEQAHTPTDDERRRVITDMLSSTPMPSLVRGYLTGLLEADGSDDPVDRIEARLSGLVREVTRQLEQVQGEPSDAPLHNHGGWDMSLQFKSYPPDAGVDAALAAWNSTGGSDRVAMRAALRAAAATQRGDR